MYAVKQLSVFCQGARFASLNHNIYTAVDTTPVDIAHAVHVGSQ